MPSPVTFSPSNVNKIMKYKRKLEKVDMEDENKVLAYLRKVENLGIDQALLSETKIGITVNKFRRRKGPVASTAARIIENWTEMVKRNLNAGGEDESSAEKRSKSPPKPSQAAPAEAKKSSKHRASSPSKPEKESSGKRHHKAPKAAPRPASEEKERVKAVRQTSVGDGVSASSGLSFADLMSAGDGPKKRKARPPTESAPPPKRAKMPAVTDAEIRASLSQPDIDYCLDERHAANGRSSKHRPTVQAASSDDLYAPLKLNSRSQVYAGRTRSQGVMTLKESCLNVLYHHVDEVGPMGEAVVFHVVQSFLERLTVAQLERIERWNPHFVPDDDLLWERHCRRDFKSCHEVSAGPSKRETWRQLYFRLRESNERRLNSLARAITANKVKAKEGERKAMIAYATSTPKAPRDVRRRQQKFGTNRMDAMELSDPKRINEGVPRKFVAAPVEVEPIGGSVVKANQKKKSNQMKKLISSIKRVGYRH